MKAELLKKVFPEIRSQRECNLTTQINKVLEEANEVLEAFETESILSLGDELVDNLRATMGALYKIEKTTGITIERLLNDNNNKMESRGEFR